MSDASSTPTMPEVPGLPGMTALLRHQAWLRRLAASLVADAARADDLTQQALLAALERPPADATRPWLAAVARNLARRLGASDLRRADRERAVAPSELLPATDDLVAQAALQHEMSAALLALEEPYRSTLLLRYFRDWKPRAIAHELRIPVATVRTRLARGLEQLRAAVVTRRGAPDRGKALALLGLCGGAARRELRRALLAAVDLARAGEGQTVTLYPHHLPASVRERQASAQPAGDPGKEGPARPARPVKLDLSPTERELRDRIVEHLRRAGGNVTEVARQMGKGRTQIQRWIARYGIDVESARQAKD